MNFMARISKQVSYMKKGRLVVPSYTGDEILPGYMGITMIHYKYPH